MKTTTKKIINIAIKAFFALLILAYGIIFLNLLNNFKERTNGLIILSEVADIRYVLSKYHILYGEYPKTNSGVLINNNFICNYQFTNNSSKCSNGLLRFGKYNNNFIYQNNENDYIIRLKIDHNIKELNCIGNKKAKQKGCEIMVTSSDLKIVEK